ncbi:hypothetical protein [Comamonas odontotermitis]|uniref:hypothetical protein n=1 Tax=Comamonas odontotermitis TaxID=379895 RepID=UPI0037525EF0
MTTVMPPDLPVDNPAVRDLGQMPTLDMEPAQFALLAEQVTLNMPPWTDELELLAGAVKTNAGVSRTFAFASKGFTEDAKATLALANASVDAALAASNFKGEWATLAGALNMPASVLHNGVIYMLLRNVANVTAEVPGVSTAWKNLSGNVTLTGDQSIAGKKTFAERLKQRDEATLAQLTVGGTRKVVLNTASSQWITLCRFSGSNRPLYSRFILSCPERHWAAEITFSKTTAGAGGDSWASIRILGAYSYFFAYPFQYRISGYGSNYASFIEMRLPGMGSTSETYLLTVLEEYQTEDNVLIDYPLAVIEPGTTRMVPNALTFGHGSGLYYRYGEIVCGGTYAPVIENNGASGQTTLESVA